MLVHTVSCPITVCWVCAVDLEQVYFYSKRGEEKRKHCYIATLQSPIHFNMGLVAPSYSPKNPDTALNGFISLHERHGSLSSRYGYPFIFSPRCLLLPVTGSPGVNTIRRREPLWQLKSKARRVLSVGRDTVTSSVPSRFVSFKIYRRSFVVSLAKNNKFNTHVRVDCTRLNGSNWSQLKNWIVFLFFKSARRPSIKKSNGASFQWTLASISSNNFFSNAWDSSGTS